MRPPRRSRWRRAICAAALVVVAGALAGCYQYRTDDQGRVIHVHTNAYRIYNATVSHPGATNAAISDWHDKLAGRGSVTVSGEANWGNTKGEAILWEVNTQDTGAAMTFHESYHEDDGIAVVVDQSVASGWTSDQTQKRMCNALGNIVGLADNPANDINTPDDCMKPGGAKTIDPEGVDAVAEYFGYGPDIEFDGDLYNQRANLLTTGVYHVIVHAGGHALTTVSLYLDAVDAAHKLKQVSSSSCATQTTPGADSCLTDLNYDVPPLSPGTHTIYARATNEFGQPDTEQFTVTVRKPALDWGFNEGWSQLPEQIARTGQAYDPDPTKPNGIGATSNRFGVPWSNVEHDAPQPDPGAPPNPDAWTTCNGEVINYSDGTGTHCYRWGQFMTTYQDMRDAGQKPVLHVTGPAPEWARANGWDSTSCTYKTTLPDGEKKDQCVYPPGSAHDDDWSDFVHRAVGTFDPNPPTSPSRDILAVEVWNEPNFDQYWFPAANPGRYTTVLGAACEGVKKAYGGTGNNCDSGLPVPVVTGGLSPGKGRPDDPTENKIQQATFLQSLYTPTTDNPNGATPYFEGIGSHIYPSPSDDYDTETWTAAEASTLSSLRNVRNAGGDTATSAPFWVTEIGVATCPNTDPETGLCDSNFAKAVPLDRQGPILEAMYNKAVSLPDVKSFLIHRYHDTVAPAEDPNALTKHMGVVFSDLTADKPAYAYLGCHVGERHPYC